MCDCILETLKKYAGVRSIIASSSVKIINLKASQRVVKQFVRLIQYTYIPLRIYIYIGIIVDLPQCFHGVVIDRHPEPKPG